jgi:putative tryptophan/tyrosine transport system substrate-binding protein
MRRRDFITLLGGTAVACSLAARAQQPALPVIGFLGSASLEKWAGGPLRWFQRGLAETGYSEGHNVAIEYRWAEEQYDRLPALATELVRQHVTVIAAPGLAVSASAAKAATTSIPIVFMIGSDPIELGLVASLNRPGGNLTGVAYLNAEVAAKRLELLRELLPAATSIALLVNPTNPIETAIQAKELQVAASALGLHASIVNASNPLEIEEAFAAIVSERADGLQIGIDPLWGSHRHQIIALAARHKIPTIYPWREFTAVGGLMNYGSSISDAFSQVGIYTGQILRGAKPADLPVQRPTKLGFVLNLKTAKALGLPVPQSLLSRVRAAKRSIRDGGHIPKLPINQN